MISRFLIALALAIAPAAAYAGTIMVFGDSLSAGYGLSQTEGWVSLLQKRLRDNRLDYAVVNASISGETTSGGASRIGAALKAHKPDIVVVELGANDGLRGHSIDLMRHNLEAIIEASRRANADVLLVGMKLPPNYGKAYTEKFQRAYVDVAHSKKVPLVPFLLEGFADDSRYFQPDRVHPTSEAQRFMLDTVWNGLKKLLKR
jgi:acyl-CoA thioesterase-1